ncbi:hypothetical protein BDF19DRAFT_232697 [Syncephalis fuscata]|nr:hypothetical protein BDF19DRAFT_232697 [Syncephalis fuscata]
MFNSMVTLLILLSFAVSVFGTATFHVGNRTFQYHTQDLLEVEVTPYTTHGVLVNAVFSKNASCEILPSVLDTARSALSSVKSDNITSVIIAIDEKKAKYHDCKTATHAGFAVSALNQYLNATSGFSIDTILYMPHIKPGIGFGSYQSLNYKKKKFSFYEGASPVNIALLPYDKYTIIVDASSKLKVTTIVTVEEGNWFSLILAIIFHALANV